MRKLMVFVLWSVSLPGSAPAQSTTTRVEVRAILIDKDLNQKPAPRLSILFTPQGDDPSNVSSARTSFDGAAMLQLIPGRYKLTTPEGVDFQGKHLTWDLEVIVGDTQLRFDLSNDNATASELTTASPVRKVDELTTLFQKYQNAVVTVWSEIGSGTGFCVDRPA